MLRGLPCPLKALPDLGMALADLDGCPSPGRLSIMNNFARPVRGGMSPEAA